MSNIYHSVFLNDNVMKKFQCMQSFILQKKSNAITLKVEYFFTIYFTINIYFQRKTSAKQYITFTNCCSKQTCWVNVFIWYSIMTWKKMMQLTVYILKIRSVIPTAKTWQTRKAKDSSIDIELRIYNYTITKKHISRTNNQNDSLQTI